MQEGGKWPPRSAPPPPPTLAIEPADFETGWFGQHGSLGRAHALFGAQLQPIMAELNERLAA